MYRSKSFIKYVYLILIEFSFGIVLTNSRSSTVWKLNSDETKIIEGKITAQEQDTYKRTNKSPEIFEDDLIFSIISSTVHFGESWIKGDTIEYICSNCHNLPNNLASNE